MSCQICFNDYNHSSHKPYSLSNCPHTFCIDCLEKLKTNKCPNCNANISAKNPNLSLLEFIQKGSYDQARDELEILLNQVNSFKKSQATLVEKKHKENALKVEEVKEQIRAKGDELIKQINTSVVQLETELEFYNTDIKCGVDSLGMSPTTSLVYISTKLLLDTNKLDETQMKEKIAHFQSVKTKLNNSILQVPNHNESIKFVPNDKIDLVTCCFGEIKNDEPKNADNYRQKALSHWIKRRDISFFFYNKAINSNPTKQQLDLICDDLNKYRREPNISDEILKCFDLATKAQPFFAKAYFYKAELLKELKQLPDALDSYTQASKLEPKNKSYKKANKDAVKKIQNEKKLLPNQSQSSNIENIEPKSKKQKVNFLSI